MQTRYMSALQVRALIPDLDWSDLLDTARLHGEASYSFGNDTCIWAVNNQDLRFEFRYADTIHANVILSRIGLIAEDLPHNANCVNRNLAVIRWNDAKRILDISEWNMWMRDIRDGAPHLKHFFQTPEGHIIHRVPGKRITYFFEACAKPAQGDPLISDSDILNGLMDHHSGSVYSGLGELIPCSWLSSEAPDSLFEQVLLQDSPVAEDSFGDQDID